MSGTSTSARLYIPVFSITLFLSAFLLFSIQPLFGKMVLPLLGGAPMVWNTAMLFYQAILLLGYAYAHITSRYLSVKVQATLHITLFLIFSFALPFLIDKTIEPPIAPGELVTWQIILMAVTIGGPFFVLSGCAPMLQYWFSKSNHKDAANPYFLYGASNIGSMLALLSYPVLVEPTLTVPMQSLGWSYGYYALIAMIAFSAFTIWNSGNKSKDPAMQTLDKKTAEKVKPTTKARLTWLLLAFLPSSLMLGVTTHISTDLAAFPLLWIIPLALYVGTFIIAFSRTGMVSLDKLQNMHLYFFIAMTFTFIGDTINSATALILLHFITFFLSALLCHKHLERIKPDAHYLTEFYLFMSIGGVCGGIFNTLIAPNIFVLPLEYGLIFAAVTFIRYMEKDDQSLKAFRAQVTSFGSIIQFTLIAVFLIFIQMAYTFEYASVIFIGMFGICMMLTFIEKKRWVFALSSMAIMITSQVSFKNSSHELLHLDRNYFGVTRVYDDEETNTRVFLHGTTLHGAQPLEPALKSTPVTYYSQKGPVGDVFSLIGDRNRPHEVAGLGLGVGSLSCFYDKNRHFDFYEIDPAVQEIAEDTSLFTMLSGCNSAYDVILGDARLQIQKADDKKYDLIFMDVFSSDNIPIHLLTKEAFAIYLDKLTDDGIIVVHVSNRFLDLRPLIDAAANNLGATALFKNQLMSKVEGSESNYYQNAIYTLMSKDKATLDLLQNKYEWVPFDGKATKVWTDDFANPVALLLSGRYNVNVSEEELEAMEKIKEGDGR